MPLEVAFQGTDSTRDYMGIRKKNKKEINT
jgi:hypothetical protein